MSSDSLPLKKTEESDEMLSISREKLQRYVFGLQFKWVGGMAVHSGGASSLDTSLLEDANVGVSDACLLEPLNEDNFIENLCHRFRHDQIYTYIGNVVVSVNPYKHLPLYSPETIFEYRSRNIYELPPHIYAIADDAYRSMRDRNLDQCVIISGESGAGKTEASKVVMQYVAAVSGKGRDIDIVKEQLLQSNPVLEAFGNAKTLRNDNSSRFGKYMDIEFDYKGDPIGGVITNYLLEKSRVAVQSKGERSFHIFYQLLSGADTSFLKSLKLRRNPILFDFLNYSRCGTSESLKLQRNPDHYAFLSPSGCAHVETVDDKSNFRITKNAMEVIGFSRDEMIAVFQLVASVLKLGNVHFQHHSNIDGTDGCKLINDDEVYEVCELLQCDCDTLIGALTQRTLETSGECVTTDLTSTEATYARDALCKAIYNRMFTWLINRINDSIRVRTRGRRKSMGVLDIYGFEVFENNSFEQFIINYCNEKLQQIFIELTLKEEQDEYIAEGIEWIHVEYFNNATICELIEKNNSGILAMLDEECLRPGTVSDETFLNKLNMTCYAHPHFESRGTKKTQSDRTLPHNSFRLIHYAGAVTYSTEGFIDKNNDLLFRDLSRAMFHCDHMLLRELFPEGNPVRWSLRRPATAGSQFKSSVSDLMRNLQHKCPNYIRCIKPNDFKRPNVVDARLVQHQVRYLGLMENVRVRRAGYAYRRNYEAFLHRYKMLSSATWPHWHGVACEGVIQIFSDLGIPQEEFALGHTKVFIRNPIMLFWLEEQRRARLHYLATLLQKTYRGWVQRERYRRARASQVIIASHYRGYKARRLVRSMRYHERCVWAAGIIAKYYYGWRVRREYRHKFRAIAGPRIVYYIRTALFRRYLLMLRTMLPSDSPADHYWPPCSPLYRTLSENIRRLHHKWRCARYRSLCDQVTRNTLREKVIASDLFKDKKINYPLTVPHPFKGDYVRLRQNFKWQRMACETNDTHVVFADIVMKINRKNGKMVTQLLVLSTNAMLVLDQRTLVIKYRIPVIEIESMSLSPYADRIAVFHLKKSGETHENGDILTKKGDFLLSSDHIIEIVSKLYLLIRNAARRAPQVHIATYMKCEMNNIPVEVCFKVGIPAIPPGTVRITRKANKIEISQS